MKISWFLLTAHDKIWEETDNLKEKNFLFSVRIFRKYIGLGQSPAREIFPK